MKTNNFEKKIVQWGIVIIIIFVILLLFVGIASHIIISSGINIHDELKLNELKHQILDGTSITFLTTMVTVLLVSVGIYFLKNAEIKLKQIEEASKNIESLKNNDIELEKLNRFIVLHIPITYIYTASSICVEKKIKKGEKMTLMTFFYKINRYLEFVNNELKKQTGKSDHTFLKQILSTNYLEDSIGNIEKIISDNQLDWDVANKTLFDLRDIQQKIGRVEK